MNHQRYFPSRIGDQIVWLNNFKLKLALYAAFLGLDPGDVTAIQLNVSNALYGLETYRSALKPANDACYQAIETALYGRGVPGNIMWVSFTPPAGAPAAVANGCLDRVFTYINEVIKSSDAYTLAIGRDLGTEGAEKPGPEPTVAPAFTLRATSGGKLEVLWTKKEFDGVKLEFDLGAAGVRNDMDLRPNYTLNWLPEAGQSAVIKVRLRYLYKGEEFGNWSEWQHWTLTGS